MSDPRTPDLHAKQLAGAVKRLQFPLDAGHKIEAAWDRSIRHDMVTVRAADLTLLLNEVAPQ